MKFSVPCSAHNTIDEPDRMIISRTPFRISLFGGGTDYPAWFHDHGGAVLATTIDKYCYLSVRYLPPFFEHRLRVVYSKIEECNSVAEIKHPAKVARHQLRVLRVIAFDHLLSARRLLVVYVAERDTFDVLDLQHLAQIIAAHAAAANQADAQAVISAGDIVCGLRGHAGGGQCGIGRHGDPAF